LYALFAREGFTPELQEAAGALDARLISLAELEQTLIAAEG
jgi:hypothetical protein